MPEDRTAQESQTIRDRDNDSEAHSENLEPPEIAHSNTHRKDNELIKSLRTAFERSPISIPISVALLIVQAVTCSISLWALDAARDANKLSATAIAESGSSNLIASEANALSSTAVAISGEDRDIHLRETTPDVRVDSVTPMLGAPTLENSAMDVVMIRLTNYGGVPAIISSFGVDVSYGNQVYSKSCLDWFYCSEIEMADLPSPIESIYVLIVPDAVSHEAIVGSITGTVEPGFSLSDIYPHQLKEYSSDDYLAKCSVILQDNGKLEHELGVSFVFTTSTGETLRTDTWPLMVAQ